MKIKENLTVREATKYAEDNGFNSVMFRLNINDKYTVSGKFLDAYYDLISIPVLGSGFTRFQELCNAHGERNISIDIIDEEEFKSGVWFDFIIRGKFAEVPDEYKPVDMT
jgi:hypothetical protein